MKGSLRFFRSLGLIALLIVAAPSFAQSINFVLDTTTGTDKKSVIPKLTWSTTPAATSCTASGAVDWTGAKSASGTATLAAVSTSVTYTLVCNWPGVTKASLTWIAPTQNTDGTPLTDLAGYRIDYGTSATVLDTAVYVQDAKITGWTSPNLAAGTWFFGVRAFNSLGLESALSNVVNRTLTAAASDTRILNLSIKIPNAPTVQ